MARKTKSPAKVKFENQVRFNHGFHDAYLSVEKGWATPEQNFGFGRSAGLVIEAPEDVLVKHFDRMYAQGWVKGYEAAQRGDVHGTSEVAWNEFAGCELAVA